MFKKKWISLIAVLNICGCAGNPSSSSSSIISSTPATSDVTPPISTSKPNSSASPSSSSSSSSIENSGDYNPDGSLHLPPPTNEKELNWSQTETKYDFSTAFPLGFQYIYGHKILNNPSFYAAGGWKITIPNSEARMGLQTPRFKSNLKLEIRLYLAGVYNSNNMVDEDNPWIWVYGFNDEGKITQIKEVDTPNNFYNYANNKNPINFYMSGENVSYLEIRFASSPYKGSQCYNFGIKEIGFKIFPYAYEG